MSKLTDSKQRAYSVGTEVMFKFLTEGATIDAIYTINSVTNVGTKTNPSFRYYLGGFGFVDHDLITVRQGVSL